MSLSEVQAGQHQVKVVLAERHRQLDSDMVLTDVEVAIFYD